MDFFVLIIMAAIAVIFIALWLDARAKGYAQQYKSALDENIKYLLNSMDMAHAMMFMN